MHDRIEFPLANTTLADGLYRLDSRKVLQGLREADDPNMSYEYHERFPKEHFLFYLIDKVGVQAQRILQQCLSDVPGIRGDVCRNIHDQQYTCSLFARMACLGPDAMPFAEQVLALPAADVDDGGFVLDTLTPISSLEFLLYCHKKEGNIPAIGRLYGADFAPMFEYFAERGANFDAEASIAQLRRYADVTTLKDLAAYLRHDDLQRFFGQSRSLRQSRTHVSPQLVDSFITKNDVENRVVPTCDFAEDWNNLLSRKLSVTRFVNGAFFGTVEGDTFLAKYFLQLLSNIFAYLSNFRKTPPEDILPSVLQDAVKRIAYDLKQVADVMDIYSGEGLPKEWLEPPEGKDIVTRAAEGLSIGEEMALEGQTPDALRRGLIEAQEPERLEACMRKIVPDCMLFGTDKPCTVEEYLTMMSQNQYQAIRETAVLCQEIIKNALIV